MSEVILAKLIVADLFQSHVFKMLLHNKPSIN